MSLQAPALYRARPHDQNHSAIWLAPNKPVNHFGETALTSAVTIRARIAVMADDAWYSPNVGPAPPRQRTPGELLFEFHVPTTHTFWRVELRDHGKYGVEAQFLDPTEVRWARTFPSYLDPTRTPREMAIAWAHEHRNWLESGCL